MQQQPETVRSDSKQSDDAGTGDVAATASTIDPAQQMQTDVKVECNGKPDDAQKMETQGQESSNGGECSDTTIGSEISKLRKQLMKKPLTATGRKKNEKERKARQIRRLRKWLMPKNAIVALHELQGPGMTEFVINTVGQLTKAEIVINNVKYEAMGSSKNQAKAKACEKALRDLAISQMTRVKQQQEAKASAQAANQSTKAVPPVAPPAPCISEMESDGDGSMYVDDGAESDDLPMEHLAAFALHKLFTEWESEGFEVPTLKPAKPKQVTAPVETGAVSVPSLPKVTKTTADLPPDASTRHPTALFAYMRPQVPYQDLGSNEDPLNREFTAGITVDGKEFVGKGRSKKLARRAAAIDACEQLFSVKFDSSVLQG